MTSKTQQAIEALEWLNAAIDVANSEEKEHGAPIVSVTRDRLLQLKQALEQTQWQHTPPGLTDEQREFAMKYVTAPKE